jgi:hypothetical protein
MIIQRSNSHSENPYNNNSTNFNTINVNNNNANNKNKLYDNYTKYNNDECLINITNNNNNNNTIVVLNQNDNNILLTKNSFRKEAIENANVNSKGFANTNDNKFFKVPIKKYSSQKYNNDDDLEFKRLRKIENKNSTSSIGNNNNTSIKLTNDSKSKIFGNKFF